MAAMQERAARERAALERRARERDAPGGAQGQGGVRHTEDINSMNGSFNIIRTRQGGNANGRVRRTARHRCAE
eukprot:5077101-Prymnesium_polylepis.1